MAAREADLLPVPYFHVVFTLPAELGAIAFHNKAIVYDPLSKVASETVLTIAADTKHLAPCPCGARLRIIERFQLPALPPHERHAVAQGLHRSRARVCDAVRYSRCSSSFRRSRDSPARLLPFAVPAKA